MPQLVGWIVSQGDAPDKAVGRPKDGSLLYNDRAGVPVDYLIGVNDHAESPTVAKHDNLNTRICAGQLGYSRNRSSGSDQEGYQKPLCRGIKKMGHYLVEGHKVIKRIHWPKGIQKGLS
jgi:hypothetical protein